MMSLCLECGEAKLSVSVSFGTRASFKWKSKSCPDGEASTCCLDHGDILDMDGQCQDEFLHCTDPGLEQERIEVTFRWIKQHVASCPFLETGVACCLPTCALGSSVAVTEFVENGAVWVFWVLLETLCIWEVLVFLVFSLMSMGLGLRRRANRWTRPLGGGRWEHCLRGLLAVLRITGNCAFLVNRYWNSNCYCLILLYVLASVKLPSLHGYDACMVNWVQGALLENFRQILCFCLVGFFRCSFLILGASSEGCFGCAS